ncbi:MAG: DUF4097 domain-containing protein [Lachnospiraceae bacterium]
MRRAKISMLILLCILTAGLCGILIYGISGRGLYSWGGSTGSYGSYGSPQLVMEKEVPLDGIDHITVQYDMNNNDIYIYEGEGDVLTIREYNELALEEKDLSTVTVSGSGVEIRGRRRNGNSFRIQVGRFGIRSAYGYTEIRLPASYKGQLSLSSASGDIRSEMDISLAEGFQAEAVSGDVVIPNITASKVSLGSSSGDIKVYAVSAGINDSAGAVDIETVSGDINVGQLAGEIDIESSSGEITVKQLTGATKIKSISGNIESESIAGDAWLGTTSGDIAVQRIDGAVTAESSSGGVKILAGAGGRNVKTTSGDIRLEGMEGSWETHSSSGGVWIKAKEGSGSISTTSGDISLELEKLAGNLNIESSSGQAKIRLLSDNAFDFKANTSSGDIETFFDDDLNFSRKGNSADGTYGKNSDGNSIVVRTTSGDVQVTER